MRQHSRLAPLVLATAALCAALLPSCKRAHAEGFDPYSVKAVADAVQLAKPVVVLVSADWCPSCRTLESGALTDSNVKNALAGFKKLKIDCTDRKNWKTGELLRDLEVKYIPVLIFRDGQGAEVGRLVGDQDPDAIIAASKKAGSGG